MLNMLESIRQKDGNIEDDDKKRMRILKSQRIAIFVVIILVMILDINDFFTNENSFFLGLFSGFVFATCAGGLFVNLKLSKRIGTRIRGNLD